MSPWWESIVQIRCGDGQHGSGCFVSPSEVLTAAHVVTRGVRVMLPNELEIHVRYQQRHVAAESIKLLARWVALDTGSDIALIRVAPQPDLGLATAFDLPPTGSSALLAASGFDAMSGAVCPCSGSIRCDATELGERFLYTGDFVPPGGMSGGPVYAALAGGVHIVGIVTQASANQLIGIALTGAALAELRGAVS